MEENKVETIDEKQLKEPNEFVVLIHNDDFTPIDLVIIILQKIFRKQFEDAKKIAWDAHEFGSSVVGKYIRDIAETKILQAKTAARRYNSPLNLTLEES